MGRGPSVKATPVYEIHGIVVGQQLELRRLENGNVKISLDGIERPVSIDHWKPEIEIDPPHWRALCDLRRTLGPIRVRVRNHKNAGGTSS